MFTTAGATLRRGLAVKLTYDKGDDFDLGIINSVNPYEEVPSEHAHVVGFHFGMAVYLDLDIINIEVIEESPEIQELRERVGITILGEDT